MAEHNGPSPSSSPDPRIHRRASPNLSPAYTAPYAQQPLDRFEHKRRSILAALNSKYIYGRIPLLHTFVFVCEMAFVAFLVARFNAYYVKRPVLTTMITNAILGGIADTVAQSVTAIQTRALRKPSVSGRDETVNINLQDFNEKSDFYPGYYNPAQRNGPPPFDFERLVRFMANGFLMAPVQHKWYAFLARAFPLVKGAGTSAALYRVAFDQLIFAPISLVVFFVFMTLAEGGGKRAVIRKLQDVYVPALKANYVIWPAVQIVNFRFMPIQLQIPFVSTVGIAWTAYLSLTNASEEPELAP